MDASDNKTYLTAEGAQKLRDELKFLTDVRKVELADRLRAAIQQGDLSENADYTAAKEEQSFLEGKILSLERMLKSAEIISEVGGDGEVRMGSRVTVCEEGYTEEETFQVVGPAEANPVEGKISNVSPLGNVLMGKRAGVKVKVNTPGGASAFKILRVD
ncbi:MAG: transcription elongation factor GreA [Chloroflexi bacterium]|nr:transcription elongation factor GreA [Chloroflexota bacterium]